MFFYLSNQGYNWRRKKNEIRMIGKEREMLQSLFESGRKSVTKDKIH